MIFFKLEKLLYFKENNVSHTAEIYMGTFISLSFLWTDQMIPGPVSCRCPSGSLETPPRWHATIYYKYPKSKGQ